jgi:hypothetical protein
VHEGATHLASGADSMRLAATSCYHLQWPVRSLRVVCCPTAARLRFLRPPDMRQAGFWTRPGLLVWGGAPRRNRTGDPILTIRVVPLL